MSALPFPADLLAVAMTGILIWPATLFLWAPRRGLSIATGKVENLPEVIARAAPFVHVNAGAA